MRQWIAAFVRAVWRRHTGKSGDLLKVFEGLVPKVLAEQGCIEYAPMIDLPNGITPLRENIVTMVEKWESLAALEAHLTSPHIAEFRRQTESLRVGLSLQILQEA